MEYFFLLKNGLMFSARSSQKGVIKTRMSTEKGAPFVPCEPLTFLNMLEKYGLEDSWVG